MSVTTIRPIGVLNFQSMCDFLARAPAEDQPLRWLLDLTRCELSLGRKDAMQLALWLEEHTQPHRARIAALVDGDAAYGILRMVSSFAATLGVDFAVFRAFQGSDAVAFLTRKTHELITK